VVNNAQLAKVWVSFNGTGSIRTNQTIYASYNVSSVYKNASGDYTINFTPGTFSNANFCATGSAFDGNGQGTYVGINNGARTASTIRVFTKGIAGGNPGYDATWIDVVIFGN